MTVRPEGGRIENGGALAATYCAWSPVVPRSRSRSYSTDAAAGGGIILEQRARGTNGLGVRNTALYRNSAPLGHSGNEIRVHARKLPHPCRTMTATRSIAAVAPKTELHLHLDSRRVLSPFETRCFVPSASRLGTKKARGRTAICYYMPRSAITPIGASCCDCQVRRLPLSRSRLRRLIQRR